MMSPIQLPISVNSLFLKAARGRAGRRTDADTRSDFWAVAGQTESHFVASNHMGFLQLLRHHVSGQSFGTQVNQQQMGIGAAGNQVKSALFLKRLPEFWRF